MNPQKILLLSAVLAGGVLALAATAQKVAPTFVDSFPVDKTDLASSGTNPYFVLVPGYQLVLKGTVDKKAVVLTIRVLAQTKLVDGVETRVVEEHETADGQVTEISRNYFAISKRTRDLYYFGEDVDIYEKGKIASHDGAWLSGVKGAKFGLMIPGTPTVGARFQQEVAPKEAMDRSEILSVTESVQTPAGKFERCLKIEETTPLEAGTALKFYAPDIGIVQDGELRLSAVTKPSGSK